MSRLKQILLATAMMAAAASDDRVYKQSNESGGMRFNPNYRPQAYSQGVEGIYC